MNSSLPPPPQYANLKSCLEEIEQYVLSWGTHATVIEPLELRRRLWRTAEELVRRYREQGRRAEDPLVDPRVTAAESTAPLPEIFKKH